MNKQLTVRLSTPSVEVRDRKHGLAVSGLAAPSPTTRAYPPFADAIAHGDPHNLVAVAEDLPGTRGHKRIVTNRAHQDCERLPDCAWWLWPWEDVAGNRPADPADLLDLRRWEGRPWLEVVQHPPPIPGGLAEQIGWFAVSGFIHGATAHDGEEVSLGGAHWLHPWSWPGCIYLHQRGPAVFNIGGSTERHEVAHAEMDWATRAWHVERFTVGWIGPGGLPLFESTGGGLPNANGTGGWDYSEMAAKPLHFALALGLRGGSVNENRGAPAEMVLRPAHSFRRKRY